MDEENLDPTVSVELLSIKIDGVLNSIAAVLDDEALKRSVILNCGAITCAHVRNRQLYRHNTLLNEDSTT